MIHETQKKSQVELAELENKLKAEAAEKSALQVSLVLGVVEKETLQKTYQQGLLPVME